MRRKISDRQTRNYVALGIVGAQERWMTTDSQIAKSQSYGENCRATSR